MNRTAPGEILRHQDGRIRLPPVHPQFVVCLFVTAGVDGSAEVQPLRVDRQIGNAQRMKPDCRCQTGGAAADHKCMDLSAFERDLHLTTCRSSYRHPRR